MQTVREQLAEALEMMGEAIGLAAYRKAARDLGRIPVAETAFKHARLALARHYAEPEGHCKSAGYLLPCDTSCPCYQEGANESHSTGCNDDSCDCWAAGHQEGLEAQRDRVGGGTA